MFTKVGLEFLKDVIIEPGYSGQVLIVTPTENGLTVGGWPCPEGGLTGQALIKDTNANGEFSWQDFFTVPSGGLQGQVLTKLTNNDGDIDWVALSSTLPLGASIPFSGTILPTGFVWAEGEELSRAAFPDFFNWATQQGSKYITEAEWQALDTGTNEVPFYSDGDGTTTFRVPRITLTDYYIIKAADVAVNASGVDALELQTQINQITSATIPNGLAPKMGIDNYIWVVDEKPSGTPGGAAVVGNQTRTLNTVKQNTVLGASLNAGANSITIPAGKYIVKAHTPGREVGLSTAWVQNITDAQRLVSGSNIYNDTGVKSTPMIHIDGSFEIDHEIDITVVQYCSASSSQVFNLGSAVSGVAAPELFTNVQLWKVG